MWIAGALAIVAILLQMFTNGRYGYFRDELYFIAASDHLDWGYVDFAPLAAALLKISRLIFGSSLHALRFLPALAFGAEVILTGLLARELGGKRFAIFFGCAGVLLGPAFVGETTRYSMNPFEPLFWMGCIYVLLLATNRNQPELLLWCGVLLGLGIENKHSTIFFIFALVVGLTTTRWRWLFQSKWFWAAVGVIVLFALPNLVWQVHHGFPTYVDLSNVKKMHKNVELPPFPFLMQQIMRLNPLSFLLWGAGLGFLLFHRESKRYRALGVTYLAFVVVMMALKAKDYYLTPIYLMLFAAGGVFWELFTRSRPKLYWLRVALPLLILPLGIAVLPFNLPILSPERIMPYEEKLGTSQSKTEINHAGPLPQHFSDEFGWPEMVEAVANVYNSLPPEVRSKTGILAGNYGEAGAIDFFGSQYGLPKSISAHQNYYYWGPRQYTGESLILLQWDREGAERWCNSVEEGPTLTPPWSMEEEHFTIWVCHGLKKPLPQVWDRLKNWN
jgi:4-amino-4-deoxy-L-arabinose transferase-like glycosyltransferase